MPVKRALKLDSFSTEKEPTRRPASRKKNLNLYSPTTGTRLISPLSSPRSNNVQEHRNGLSNDNRKKKCDSLKDSCKEGQPQMKRSDNIVAQPEIDASLERFMQLRQKLTSLQALEGTRELDNIISVSDNSCNLKSEVEKNRKLMEQVRRLKRSPGGLPAQECNRPVNSFEFLKSLIE